MKLVRVSLVALPLLLVSPGPNWADAFDAALRASEEGRYGEAAAGFFELADGGDGVAAYNLALLFATGRGIPQSDREALYWAWRARLADVRAASAILGRLWPPSDPARRKEIADRLEADLLPLAESGNGEAMLKLAAVLGVLRVKPDLVAAHGWQSIAAALDVPGALVARDATLGALPLPERAKAQDHALTAFAGWCKRQQGEQPPACVIVTAQDQSRKTVGQ